MEVIRKQVISKKLEPWCELTGKVVMVTGASSGLGREFCLDLAKAGCKIIAAARRSDMLKSLCDEINDLSSGRPQAVALALDISSDGFIVEGCVNKAWDVFGRIDALINNAGIRGTVKSPLEISEEEWNRVIKTNLTGSWLVSKYIGIRMRDAGQKGSIINITSMQGLNRVQLPGAVAYSSSKAAIMTMSKVMAMELGVYNIRVNSVAPGLFSSEITKDLMQKNWINVVAQRTVPLGTFGMSDPALTSIVRYLIHDSSEYVSGNIFIVDAGCSLPGVPIFSSL